MWASDLDSAVSLFGKYVEAKMDEAVQELENSSAPEYDKNGRQTRSGRKVDQRDRKDARLTVWYELVQDKKRTVRPSGFGKRVVTIRPLDTKE